MTSRPAWSTRANFRTVSKATEKSYHEKQNKIKQTNKQKMGQEKACLSISQMEVYKVKLSFWSCMMIRNSKGTKSKFVSGAINLLFLLGHQG